MKRIWMASVGKRLACCLPAAELAGLLVPSGHGHKQHTSGTGSRNGQTRRGEAVEPAEGLAREKADA